MLEKWLWGLWLVAEVVAAGQVVAKVLVEVKLSACQPAYGQWVWRKV